MFMNRESEVIMYHSILSIRQDEGHLFQWICKNGNSISILACELSVTVAQLGLLVSRSSGALLWG